jgi:hypothetical protein
VTVLVYTALYGGRDAVRPQAFQTRGDVDWLCITDSANVAPFPFQTMTLAERKHEHPNMAAKWWRTHPPFNGLYDQALTPRAPYAYCIWIDANMQVTSQTFVSNVIGSINDGMAAWAHPRRDDIYDEIEASLGNEGQGGRYDALPLREQGEAYRAEGYPEHAGLYATGTLLWTPERAADVGAAWWDECVRWGYQDQVSFPVVCWRLGVKPGTFPLDQTHGRFNKRAGWWNNAWMMIHNHEPGTG